MFTFWRFIYITFQISHKEATKSRNQFFSYYLFLMIKGSGAWFIYQYLTKGSGSVRPKNIWILRIQIWTPNIALKVPSHEIRSPWKWYGWMEFHGIKTADGSVAYPDPNPDPDPPDPHVFGPPVSGSFYHHAKLVRKTWFLLFCDFFLTFYLWKMM